jgi:hypothetical protein
MSDDECCDDLEVVVRLGLSDSVWVPKDVRCVSGFPLGFHSDECHDFWLRRYGRCVYCEQGSKPVSRGFIVDFLNRRR